MTEDLNDNLYYINPLKEYQNNEHELIYFFQIN